MNVHYTAEQVRAWDNDMRSYLASEAARSERDEHRDAVRAVGGWGACGDGNHHYVANRAGGGTCRYCGDTIHADELKSPADELDEED